MSGTGLKLRTKALILASFFALATGSIAIYVVWELESSASEVVSVNAALTESTVHRLNEVVLRTIDSLAVTEFFVNPNLPRNEEAKVDSLLASLTAKELLNYRGLEGGLYFQHIDRFLGYSFPTSPEPRPAFGPPPRSYEIIRRQARQSITESRRIVQLHQFDPATFPLVTEPIFVRGRIVGSIWARVHIERLIPTVSLTGVLIIGGILSLIGFVIALVGTWNLRKRVEEIRLGLRDLQTDTAFRFSHRRGVFGEIESAINEMMEAHTNEQNRREKLEHQIHQQDKMATLGTLIAGVAHEVKTPLAIIKTRIQMWERKLRQLPQATDPSGIVSEESMDLVVHEVNRLSELVKRLLLFSKPSSKKLHTTSVNQLLLQSLSVIQVEAASRGISIEQNLRNDLPQLQLDRQAMEEVFLNVGTNALEAMDEHGKLTVSTDLLPDGSAVVITFDDTGHGIPPEIMDKIFNPFFTTKEQGVGLGLSISYEIIRAHNGTIVFLPADGKGTSCQIQLPTTTSYRAQ